MEMATVKREIIVNPDGVFIGDIISAEALFHRDPRGKNESLLVDIGLVVSVPESAAPQIITVRNAFGELEELDISEGETLVRRLVTDNNNAESE